MGTGKSDSVQERDEKICKLFEGRTPEQRRVIDELEAFQLARKIASNPKLSLEECAREFGEELDRMVRIRNAEPSSFGPGFNESANTIEGIVRRRGFEGAAGDIASRHLALVREQRPVRVAKAILEVMGGEGATWVSIVAQLKQYDSRDCPILQNTAQLIQKTIAVAIDNAHADDGAPPLYPYR